MRCIALISLGAAIIACGGERPADRDPGGDKSGEVADLSLDFGRLTEHQLGLGELRLGMTQAEAIETLGQPDSTSVYFDSEIVGDSVWTLRYGSLRADVYGKYGIQQVICLDRGCATSAGLGVGSTKTQVESLYGRGFPSTDPKRPFLQYEASGRDCGLTFTLEADTVSSVVLWCDWS